LEPQAVEQWLPIYTRIVGIILGIALVAATILGYAGVEFAGAYVFVTGLIFYKSVHDYRLPRRGESDDHADRWSHLG
jgi:hypothetical protein